MNLIADFKIGIFCRNYSKLMLSDSKPRREDGTKFVGLNVIESLFSI